MSRTLVPNWPMGSSTAESRQITEPSLREQPSKDTVTKKHVAETCISRH